MHLMSMLLTLEADKSTGTLYKIDIKVHGCLYWLLLIQLTAIFLCSFFYLCFDFAITVDIQYYVIFRSMTQWLDIYNLQNVPPLILVPTWHYTLLLEYY